MLHAPGVEHAAGRDDVVAVHDHVSELALEAQISSGPRLEVRRGRDDRTRGIPCAHRLGGVEHGQQPVAGTDGLRLRLRASDGVAASVLAVSPPFAIGNDAPAVSTSVPAGTQSGQEIRLRGHGMPRLRGSGRGDLHVLVTVVVPSRLSKRERELLTELAEASAPAALPKSGPTLGERLRDLFS